MTNITTVVIEKSLLVKIEFYKKKHKIQSRSGAIRQIIEQYLNQEGII